MPDAVKRVLLVINRSSATGHDKTTAERLHSILSKLLGPETDLLMRLVHEHAQAKEVVEAFLASGTGPTLVICGGGGGTLRAAIEGVCRGAEPGNLPTRERVRIAALRMGSGNIVAKQFGIPRDPESAIKGIVANLQADRTVPCCIMRCEAGGRSSPEVLFATAMAGFGQFGRSPGDLLRWHRRLAALRSIAAGLLGIERVNTFEYALSFVLRLLRCALSPDACELVEARLPGRIERIRLLSGVVMNFPVKQLPFEPGLRVEDPALSVHLLPYPGRWDTLLGTFSMKRLAGRAVQGRIAGPDELQIRLVSGDSAECFLDEDPVSFYQTVRIRVAGTLAFVPGPDYRWPAERSERR